MKRMKLRDVPDEVYTTLVQTAAKNRQPLNAYVVDRLTEMTQAERLDDYMAAYPEPHGTGVTLDDAATAVREVRGAL